MKNKKAFTLVELLLGITIVAILSGLVIVVINPEKLKKKVRDAQRKKDLEIVALALEQYYADNNGYPNIDYSSMAATLSPSSGTTYLKNTPNDPMNGVTGYGYSYCYRTDTVNGSQNFVMCALQEASTIDQNSQDLYLANCDTTPPAQNDATLGRYCISNPL